MPKTVLLLATLLGGAVGALAQDPEPLTPHRTGTFQARLTERSPESDANRWSARFQFPGALSRWDYSLASESFSLYVPDDYDADGEPYGVLVWISPVDTGAIPPPLRTVFDERRLIWISPDNAGNQRHLFPRAGLALDAALNVQKAYNVDPSQIFVSGLSGGGRMATMHAVAYPELFAGGFPIIGVTTYLAVRPPSTGQLVPQFPSPAVDVLDRARTQPLVIMTGSGDFNRGECRAAAEAFEGDGFTNLHLLDIEGMGHELPSPRNLARGLDLLLSSVD